MAMSSSLTPIKGIGFGLVVSCLIGLPQLYDKFMIARFVAAATGLALVFLIVLFGKQRWLVPRSPVVLPYLAFLLLSGCSIFWATNTAEAIFAFATQLLTPLTVIVVYTLLARHWQTTQRVLWLSAAIILVVYLSFAVLQLVHLDGLSFDQLYHVGGLSGHKNLLAAMLFLLSAFLLTAFGLFRSRALKWGSGLLFVISFAVIILLKSRAVLLSVIVAAVFFGVLLLYRRLRRTKCVWVFVIVSIVVVYAFLTLGLRWFAERSVPHTTEKSEVETQMLSTSSLVERCQLWDKTYQLADRHPWTGCGVGNWQVCYPEVGLEGLYRADYWNINFTKPHNEYLGVLAETGYLGLLLYLAFLVGLVINAFFAIRETGNREDFIRNAILLSTFVGCCVNALFDFPNSRIEHILWVSVLMAMLVLNFGSMSQLHNKSWEIGLLLIALTLVILGLYRLKGERRTFEMQQALKNEDWAKVERCCDEALSSVYTLDPVGLPLHWYQGKAQKHQGKAQALESFRKAKHYAPCCKENLNDLGLAELHDGNPLEGVACLKKAIRISPHYLYPKLNLAYYYLNTGVIWKAKEVADAIDFDVRKRDMLKADAVFFEPLNTESMFRKIDADYEAVVLLREKISGKTCNK